MNNNIIHSLALYLRRFRLELLGFWAVSLTLSWLLASGVDEQAVHPLKVLEMILLVVVAARLALAETTFRVTGGWRTRPLSRNAVAWARFWTVGIVAGIPMLVRLVVWWVAVPLPDSERRSALLEDASGLILFGGGFFLLAHLVSKLLEREKRGLALFVVFPLAVLGTVGWLWTSLNTALSISGGPFSGYGVPPGVRAIFPPETTFIGARSGNMMDGGTVEEVLRMPLKQGTRKLADGTSVTINSFSAESGLTVNLSEYFPDEADFIPRLYVVRFGDGSISGEVNGDSESWKYKALLYRSRKYIRSSIYRSPRDYPWNERSWAQLLDGADLILYRITNTPLEEKDGGPSLAVRETVDETRVRSALVALHLNESSFDSGRVGDIILSSGEVVEPLLAWPVWSDAAFDKLVLPVLRKRAEERHREGLVKRFKSDSRLAGFLMEKGWGEGVMPQLIGELKEGRPLRSQELVLIANLKDASLADPLVEAFLRLIGKNEAVGASLQNHPGVDWPAVVRRGWEQEKIGDPLFTQWWTFACWAAREGDVSALRRVAVEAANGKKWEREQLTEIVDSAGEDPVKWLARNHGTMRYDPAMKRFSAAR